MKCASTKNLQFNNSIIKSCARHGPRAYDNEEDDYDLHDCDDGNTGSQCNRGTRTQP